MVSALGPVAYSTLRLRGIFYNHSLRSASSPCSPCTLLLINQQKVDKRVRQAQYRCEKNLLGYREQLHNAYARLRSMRCVLEQDTLLPQCSLNPGV